MSTTVRAALSLLICFSLAFSTPHSALAARPPATPSGGLEGWWEGLSPGARDKIKTTALIAGLVVATVALSLNPATVLLGDGLFAGMGITGVLYGATWLVNQLTDDPRRRPEEPRRSATGRSSEVSLLGVNSAPMMVGGEPRLPEQWGTGPDSKTWMQY